MDQLLRLLQRQSQQDPLLKDAYIRALERAVGGAENIQVTVWVVLYCYDETSSDDITVFATATLAEQYIMNRMMKDIKTAYQEGALDITDVNTAVSLYEKNNFDGLDQLYTTIAGFEAWFEISKKEVLFTVSSS